MFESLPKGFSAVTDLAVLQGKNSRRFVPFFAGDKIVISEVVASSTFLPKGGKKGKDEKDTFFVGATVNGRERMLPLGTFNRFPRNCDELLAEFPLMRDLYDGDALDRFNLLKGKTIKVVKLVEGEALDFEKSNLETKDFVYKTSKFPVFELV